MKFLGLSSFRGLPESARISRLVQGGLLPFVRSLSILVLMSLLAITAGCQTTNLKLDDHDRFTYSGRVSYEIFPGNDKRRAGSLLDLMTDTSNIVDGKPVTARSTGIRPTLSVDTAIAGIRGSDHQQIAAGEVVKLGAEIFGPARIKVSAENLRAHVAARGGVRFFDVFSLEGIIGVGLDDTDVRIQGGGVDSREESLAAVFLTGVRSTLRPIPLFDLYAEFLVSYATLDTEITDLQVGIDLNLTRNVSLFAGYRWWDYEKNNFDLDSDVDIDFRGPTAGLSLKF